RACGGADTRLWAGAEPTAPGPLPRAGPFGEGTAPVIQPSTPDPAQLGAALAEIDQQRQTIRRLLLEKYEPIAIVGIGLRFPGGNNTPEEFARFLREGRSGIRPVPADRWDVARLPTPHPH